MSLDHFPLFPDRRASFQPSERASFPSHDPLLPSSSAWSYPSRHDHDSFHQQYPAWNIAYPSPPPPSPPPYVSALSSYRSSFALFDYPASSRTLVPALHPHARTLHQNQKYDPPWGDGLYTIDDPETSNSERPASSVATSPSARASSIASSASIPPVKVEPEDAISADCFVMEFSSPTPAAQASSSLAPPTEVPLRATQASKAMRKMMGVFRLNPFSMHESSGQLSTTWTGEEAGPLDEEPQMFEFQLEIPGYDPPDSDPLQPQLPPSDKFGDLDDPAAWADCNEPPLQYPTPPHPAWIGHDSPASFSTLPSLRPYSPQPPFHSPSPSSLSPRRTPLESASSDYASSYTLPVPSSCATSIDNLPSISTMARRWSNSTTLQHPFML